MPQEPTTVQRALCVALFAVLYAVIILPPACAGQSDGKEAALRPYHKVSGVSGTINSIGSDTLNNLITLWAEGFRKQYPNVKIQVEGKGSSTAPPALIENTAQLGPMSRTMKSSEIDAFETKFGYPPPRTRSPSMPWRCSSTRTIRSPD
ncbi:MAG: substrate-binding domain-containing protein [Nitrospira sp.]